jgi:hypothetical protein
MLGSAGEHLLPGGGEVRGAEHGGGGRRRVKLVPELVVRRILQWVRGVSDLRAGSVA